MRENPVLQSCAHLGLSQCVLTGHSLDLLVTGLLSKPLIGPSIKTKLKSHSDIESDNVSTEEVKQLSTVRQYMCFTS